MASETGEMWNSVKDGQKKLRDAFAVPCPKCREKQPKRTPTNLLPQQRCKVDGYVDPRARISDAEYERVTGFRIIR